MIDIFKFLKKSVRIELIYTNENGEKCSFDSEVIEIEEDKIFIKHPVSRLFSFDDVDKDDLIERRLEIEEFCDRLNTKI